MRVRNFSKKKVTGRFASHKRKKMSHWESRTMEKEYMYLLDYDPDVLDYQEQPLKIKYLLEGSQHEYTPDLFVRRRYTKQIVEVKPEKDVPDKMNQIKFKAATLFCERHGYEFCVVTERHIHTQLQRNIKFLYRYARQTVSPAFRYLVQSKMQEAENWEMEVGRLAALLAGVVGKRDPLSYIYTLVYHRNLIIDMNVPITSSSKVALPMIKTGGI